MAESSSPSLEDRLNNLVTRASAKDAIKDYEASTELYSQATELQAEINGEMNVENADLLYAYGKSLYNVAVSKSDVLGPKVAGENQDSTQKLNEKSNTTTGEDEKDSGNLVASAIAQGSSIKQAEDASESKKANSTPFFQFTGDENFDESDEEEADGGEENDEAGESPEEQDDFANAFEVLDLARVLFAQKLKQLTISETSDKPSELTSEVHKIKERLADTHDLQAEISLEGERFLDAVSDLRASLELKRELLPLEDPAVAECHYKLSLALEFSSTTQKGESDGDGVPEFDKEMRNEAAENMKTAIESCKSRITAEEQQVSNETDEAKADQKRRRIEDVKDIVSDMEQRVSLPCFAPSTSPCKYDCMCTV